MNYAIVYSSKTGNTKQLAEVIQRVLPTEKIIYVGQVDEKALEADCIFVGFWTDKGTCDESIQDFLKKLRNKKIFLFGTAGFGKDQAYYESILGRVKTNIKASNTVMGQYMCQGKMPASVLARYEKMLEKSPQDPKLLAFIDNFEMAKTHPDATDCHKLSAMVQQTI